MYPRLPAVILLAIMARSLPAQHTGHPLPEDPMEKQPQVVDSGTPVPSTHEALKRAQELFRWLEKAQAGIDEGAVNEAARRYEQAVETVVSVIDTADRSDRTYARDLERAEKALQRQLHLLRQFQTAGRPDRVETLTRVTDSVTLALDAIASERRSLLAGAGTPHGAHSGSTAGHGCGSRRIIPWLKLR